MGKRKKSSRKPTGAKKREPLATVFRCPFCANEKSVHVTVDKKMWMGTVDCRQCGQHYEANCELKSMTQPIDVYFDWIDACEAVAKDQVAESTVQPPSNMRPARRAAPAGARAGLAPGERYTEEDAGFINDEGVEDAEAEFLHEH